MTTQNHPLNHNVVVQAALSASVLSLAVYDLAQPSQSMMAMRTCN